MLSHLVGIIPARAGFTCFRSSSSFPLPDHPRSRGVYRSQQFLHQPHLGSSPLARGLPVDWLSADGAWRIIPARAGFTASPMRTLCAATDHPRSRGVYPMHRTGGAGRGGSSPLARGLQCVGLVGPLQCRIIPARAGFTVRRPRRSTPVSDHPRSRGVYFVLLVFPQFLSGSSPLARGLRSLPETTMSSIRIIPARAGFTPERVSIFTSRADHPRSRGVYVRGRGEFHLSVGSSPLARGLRTLRQADVPARRIIPARAGFTHSTGAWLDRLEDHPRSRGVYGATTSIDRSRGGSSPLARGLPGPDRAGGRELGIIPARAGFTRRAVGRRCRPRDHPRSRGVYAA